CRPNQALMLSIHTVVAQLTIVEVLIASDRYNQTLATTRLPNLKRDIILPFVAKDRISIPYAHAVLQFELCSPCSRTRHFFERVLLFSQLICGICNSFISSVLVQARQITQTYISEPTIITAGFMNFFDYVGHHWTGSSGLLKTALDHSEIV